MGKSISKLLSDEAQLQRRIDALSVGKKKIKLLKLQAALLEEIKNLLSL